MTGTFVPAKNWQVSTDWFKLPYASDDNIFQNSTNINKAYRIRRYDNVTIVVI